MPPTHHPHTRTHTAHATQTTHRHIHAHTHHTNHTCKHHSHAHIPHVCTYMHTHAHTTQTTHAIMQAPLTHKHTYHTCAQTCTHMHTHTHIHMHRHTREPSVKATAGKRARAGRVAPGMPQCGPTEGGSSDKSVWFWEAEMTWLCGGSHLPLQPGRGCPTQPLRGCGIRRVWGPRGGC